jgi:hypothetical protein
MGSRKCPICESENWGIAPTFAQLPTRPQKVIQAPVRANPCVALICQTCGNTLFFNAIVMELLPKSEG